MGIFNFFSKKENKEDLNKGLEKTKEGVFSKLARAVAGKSKVDDEVLDNLEEVLITSDVGVDHDAAHHRTDRKARGRGQVHEYGRAERHSPQRNLRPARGEPSRGRAGIRLRKKGRDALRRDGGRRQRSRQDHDDRQARIELRQAGQKVYIGAADTFRPLRSTSWPSGPSGPARR